MHSKSGLYSIVDNPLPFTPNFLDPIICPFFIPLITNWGITLVLYSALADSHNTTVDKQIARDIEIATSMKQPPQLDRVFIFKWLNANTVGETKKVRKVSIACAIVHYAIIQ